ncbi:MAG: outer membrane beta-barrel protein [Bacteroidia bacterium]
MKKLIFLPFFLFTLGYAQNETSEWYFGIQLGAGSSYRTLDPQNEAAALVVSFRNESEVPIIGQNGGLVIGRKLNDHFWFESGVQFSRLGLVERVQVDTLTGSSIPGFPPPASPMSGELSMFDLFYHVNIPLLVKAYTNTGKFRGFFFLGPQVNISVVEQLRSVFVSENGVAIFEDDLQANFNPLIISLIGGGGFSSQFHENFSLEARFLARRDITPVADEPVRQQMHYVAGNLGVLFHF